MNILITEHFHKKALKKLENHDVNLKVTEKTLNQAEIIITRSKTKIDKVFLNKASNVKLIITQTSGFDHIDIEECKKRNITCSYTPDANALSASELTLTLALMALKDIKKSTDNIKNNTWRKNLESLELSNKVWGIVGFGRVGKSLYDLLKPFSTKILVYDPYVENIKPQKIKNLEDIFKHSDIVSFHVPKTNETHHMITSELVSKMKKKSILINLSRGSVVDYDVIKFACKNDVTVCLDVFENEPLTTYPFKGLENIICTPHIGGFTEEALKRVSMHAVDLVDEFVENSKLSKNTLPPNEKWYKG